MKIDDFKLEVFFSKYEFTAPYLLTQSDCESMTTRELLAYEPGSEEGLLNQWLGYTETLGDPELRKEVAKLYKTMTDEDILIFHGAQEGIFGFMNVMLEEGDHMIAQFPSYQSLYEVANSVPHCSYSKWRIYDDGEKWSMDFDELETLIRPNTKMIAINTPNNSTGYTLTNEELERLCDICGKHDIWLFSDEVYKGLELDGEKRDWAADHYEKAVSLGVLSKSYGLSGLRVGWLALKDHELLTKLNRFKNYLSICDAAPSEYLGKIAVRHTDELNARSVETIKKNKAIADAFFKKYDTLFEAKPLQVGPVAFHKLLIDMPVKDFCRIAVDRKGVLLLPSEIYDYEGQYFRFGYGRKNMPEALAKLEEFLIEEGFIR